MRPAMKFVLDKLGCSKIGAEIGVETGEHAYDIAWHLKPAKLYLVDLWDYKYPDDAKIVDTASMVWAMKRLEQFYGIYYLRMPSLEASLIMPFEYLDFVYIDADHFQGIKQDLEAWFPKIKNGGIISGHDYDVTYPAVTQAVNDFAVDYGLTINSKNGDWWAVK